MTIEKPPVSDTEFSPGNRSLGLLIIASLLVVVMPRAEASRSGSRSGEQQTKADSPLLEVGKPVDGELPAGGARSYRINLVAGQYLQVITKHPGFDIAVTLVSPSEKRLAEVSAHGVATELASLSCVAEESGTHRLEIRSLDKNGATGLYTLTITQLRIANAQDTLRVNAERVYAEAVQLHEQEITASLQKAVKRYEEALALWREIGDRAKEAETLSNIGSVYKDLGKPREALDWCAQALTVWRSIPDRHGEGDALLSIGEVYDDLSERQKSLEYYNEALRCFRDTNDMGAEGTTLHDIGLVYWKLGKYQKAIEYLEPAVSLRRNAGDRAGEAQTLNAIGSVYNSLGDRDKALEYLNKSLPIRRQMHDQRGEAGTLSNLGITYDYLGEKQKAFEHYDQALALRRTTGDKEGEAVTLGNIGMLYGTTGDHDGALSFFNKALKLYRDVEDLEGQGVILNNIGNIYDMLGDRQKALDFYNQSLPLRQKAEDRSGEAYTLNNIGHVYDTLGNKTEALSFYDQALAIRHQIGDRLGEAQSLNNLAGLYATLGEASKELECYRKALPLARSVRDPRVTAAVLSGMARLETRRGNLPEARALIAEALDLTDFVRTRASQDLRASYAATVHGYHEQNIELLMRMHQLHQKDGFDRMALHASERFRARSLIELLTEAQADIRQGVDPSLLKRERSLQLAVSTKADRLTRLLNNGNAELAEAAANEIEALKTELQRVQGDIRNKSPRYAALTQPQSLTSEDIQREVVDSDTLLLEYSLGDERSYEWAISTTSVISFELPKRSVIEEATRNFFGLLTARGERMEGETATRRRSRIARADAAFPAAAADLSNMLLAPVVAQLGTKRLVIVCDGALQYIPFAVLPEPLVKAQAAAVTRRRAAIVPRSQPSQRPLVVKHEIVSLPSASTLAVLRSELAARSVALKTAAVFADPVFEPTDLRVKRSAAVERRPSADLPVTEQRASLNELSRTRSLRDSGVTGYGRSISRLPYSQREAEVIKRLVPEQQRKVLLAFDVNHETATDPEMENYRFIHFATHSLLNSKHPELSGILLSLVDEQGRAQQPGMLSLAEVYNLKLRADAVVLSACETALGKDVKGEGLIGLTRGFMYAGAASVVASLWKVDDRATAELMRLFYEGILGNQRLRPAEALRRAQIEMWRNPEWRAPHYWSAFILQGEWK